MGPVGLVSGSRWLASQWQRYDRVPRVLRRILHVDQGKSRYLAQYECQDERCLPTRVSQMESEILKSAHHKNPKSRCNSPSSADACLRHDANKGAEDGEAWLGDNPVSPVEAAKYRVNPHDSNQNGDRRTCAIVTWIKRLCQWRPVDVFGGAF